jgi:hypothetical protein
MDAISLAVSPGKNALSRQISAIPIEVVSARHDWRYIWVVFCSCAAFV